MRVIAGSARGLALQSLDGLDTRPTLDRVKESLFNILMPRLAGSAVLDAFAGTGALGIEALSRGAASCLFIEHSRHAAAVTEQNLRHTRLEGGRVLVCDAFAYLASTREAFDLILLDPPFGKGLAASAAALIARHGLLRPGGIIAAESAVTDELPQALHGLQKTRVKTYGKTAIHFYIHGEP